MTVALDSREYSGGFVVSYFSPPLYHANIISVLMDTFPANARLAINLEESLDSCFVHPKKLSSIELVLNNKEVVELAYKNMDKELFAFQEISYKE